MATLAVVLLGWISLGRLGTDLLPDLQTPVVTVDLRAPGKSPREMEERYTRRLERDVSTIRRVKRVYSITRAGQSVVVAEFAYEADMDFALLDVQKKVGAYAVADDVTSLDVLRQDPQTQPVMRIAVASDGDVSELDDLLGTVETLIKPRLEALDGVASAEMEGGAEKEIQVVLDAYLLEAFALAPSAVVDRIRAAGADISGGMLKDGQQSYLVKALGRLNRMEDVTELIVGDRPASETAQRLPVRVKDVGQVMLVVQDRETIVRIDGRECVGLAIYKEAGANTVAVVETATGALEEMAATMPALSFATVENQARFVQSAIGEVKNSALYGALLAIGVLLLVLRSGTATLVIGLAIPISVLATFTLMYFQNLTLNLMTLGGLALGAGMLVDNAIVVIENIYRRMELGESAFQASSLGASEVGRAILASTITTISVFLPIVYLQGLAGELFKDQAWTVAFSLLSSLCVAMTTVPMLASRLFGSVRARASTSKWHFYRRMLSGVLNHKAWIAVFTVGLLCAAGVLFLRISYEFIPREDQGMFQVEIALPEGTRLDVTDRYGLRVQEIIRSVGGADVAHIYVRSGIDPARLSGTGEPMGPNRATLSVLLVPQRTQTVPHLVDVLDAHIQALPDVEVTYHLHDTALGSVMGKQDAPMQIEITGENLDILNRLTADLQSRVEALPTVYNVRSSFQGGQPEVDLQIRGEIAAAFGLTTQSLSQTLARQLSGEIAGELSKDQRTRDIRVKYEDMDLRELGQLRIEGSGGAILTLSDVADLQIVEGPREILREGQTRVGRITGYLTAGSALSEAVVQVRAVLSDMVIPAGYRVSIGGEERDRSESFKGLKFALILSIVLIYMVMASLFESLVHPFTVMLSVPLAGIGVVFAFYGLGLPLSVMAYIGVIMLGGIAVNGAIILVDRINQLCTEGFALREAVLSGAQDRVRPILMTSATTVLALLPMALGFGEGARLRAPMAVAVIGGLITSTLMTLIVVPVMYEWIDRLRRRERP